MEKNDLQIAKLVLIAKKRTKIVNRNLKLSLIPHSPALNSHASACYNGNAASFGAVLEIKIAFTGSEPEIGNPSCKEISAKYNLNRAILF